MDNMLFRNKEMRLKAALCKTKAIRALFLGFLCAIATGCFTTPPPLYDYGPDGERIEKKRIAKRLLQTDITMARFYSTAYGPGEKFSAKGLSPDEAEIFELLGPPQYIRKPFRSLRDERVDEWLYPRLNQVVQFIRGHKTYQGEITDTEKTLLRYGYPAICWMTSDETGTNRQTWIYKYEAEQSHLLISFTDGKIVTSTEHVTQ